MGPCQRFLTRALDIAEDYSAQLWDHPSPSRMLRERARKLIPRLFHDVPDHPGTDQTWRIPRVTESGQTELASLREYSDQTVWSYFREQMSGAWDICSFFVRKVGWLGVSGACLFGLGATLVGASLNGHTRHSITETERHDETDEDFLPDVVLAPGGRTTQSKKLIDVEHKIERRALGMTIPLWVCRLFGDHECGTFTYTLKDEDLKRAGHIAAAYSSTAWNQARRAIDRMANIGSVGTGRSVNTRHLAQVVLLRNAADMAENFGSLKSNFMLSLGDAANA